MPEETEDRERNRRMALFALLGAAGLGLVFLLTRQPGGQPPGVTPPPGAQADVQIASIEYGVEG